MLPPLSRSRRRGASPRCRQRQGVLLRRAGARRDTRPSGWTRLSPRFADREDIRQSAPASSYSARGVGAVLPGESFDRAVSVCVLEHTRDDARVLRGDPPGLEARRSLRPGRSTASIRPRVTDSFRERLIGGSTAATSSTATRGFVPPRGRGIRNAGDEVPLRRASLDRDPALRLDVPLPERLPASLSDSVHPLLWLDHHWSGKKRSGMILAAKARKRA